MYIIKAWCYNLDTAKALFQGCYVELRSNKDDFEGSCYRVLEKFHTQNEVNKEKYFENHSSVACVFPKTVVIMDNHQTLCHTAYSPYTI